MPISFFDLLFLLSLGSMGLVLVFQSILTFLALRNGWQEGVVQIHKRDLTKRQHKNKILKRPSYGKPIVVFDYADRKVKQPTYALIHHRDGVDVFRAKFHILVDFPGFSRVFVTSTTSIDLPVNQAQITVPRIEGPNVEFVHINQYNHQVEKALRQAVRQQYGHDAVHVRWLTNLFGTPCEVQLLGKDKFHALPKRLDAVNHLGIGFGVLIVTILLLVIMVNNPSETCISISSNSTGIQTNCE